MQVRPETPGEEADVHRLVASAFPTEAEAFLVDELRRTGALRISLVATSDEGRAVGYCAFSPVRTLDGREGAGLAPVAVDAAFRRRGIAAQLIETGLGMCRLEGFAYAVVLGSPEYYRRFGFEPAADHGLTDEFEGGAAFQVLALQPDGIPKGAGVVRYAAAFSAFG